MKNHPLCDSRILHQHIFVKPCSMQQGTLNLRVLCILCAGSGNDHDIKSAAKQILMQPVALPDQSGDVVPDNTVSYFFTHRNPKPVFAESIF